MNKEEQFKVNVRDLFNKMAWLNKFKMEASLKGYKPSEVHCIESVKNNEDSNVTKLAESLYMTRGAISKLTKKLVEKNLIESYQKQGNRKEIYFRLTEQGQRIYNIHEEQHKEFQERDRVLFDQITEEQFDCMIRFVEAYSNHLDAEIKKEGITIN